MNCQERINRYETAQETIGFLMAIRTAAIHEERAKPKPNEARIAQLRTEFYKFDDELNALFPDDDAAVQRVLDEYCPLVRADNERRRGNDAVMNETINDFTVQHCCDGAPSFP